VHREQKKKKKYIMRRALVPGPVLENVQHKRRAVGGAILGIMHHLIKAHVLSYASWKLDDSTSCLYAAEGYQSMTHSV
jgi:hypothetical protein